MATKKAKTRTPLNLRDGPGTNHAILKVLTKGTSLEVLEELGDWLKVNVGNQQGFVHRFYVLFEEQIVMDGFLRAKIEDENDPLHHLKTLALEPAEDDRLGVPPDAVYRQKEIARVWNRYGGFLAALAKELGIEASVALAVLFVESGGRGFSGGKMIIRFENHKFYDFWGRFNQGKFRKHFRFDQNRRWQNHHWRRSKPKGWQQMHGGNLPLEWKVFDFARNLAGQASDLAAKKSISMGLPQVMGFNYAKIGYESVDEMFAAFSESERPQIIGLFDFIKGPTEDSEMIRSLQEEDFTGFAARYNGPGQAARYGEMIRSLHEDFLALQGNT